MPVMQHAQETCGCLDEEVQSFIAEKMGVPLSKVYGVSTFYSLFKLEPAGKYTVGLCLGTACYVRGAQKVYDALVSNLGVQAGRTTPDGLFTLAPMRCIGCCGLAPAMMIGDEVFGRLTPDQVPDIIEKFRKKAS